MGGFENGTKNTKIAFDLCHRGTIGLALARRDRGALIVLIA
jgi:hypothetical protein